MEIIRVHIVFIAIQLSDCSNRTITIKLKPKISKSTDNIALVNLPLFPVAFLVSFNAYLLLGIII